MHYFSNKINILLYIIVLFSISGCKNTDNFFFDAKKTDINIPIISIELTSPINIQNLEKYDQKSLLPTKFTIGTEHTLISKIQTRLMDLGYMDIDKPTTFYSENTALSVSKFQRQYGLNENGILTLDLYEKLLNKNAKTYEAKRGHSGTDITMIQQRLYELSYLISENEINGYFGEKTETAIKNMQKNNKIKTTGTVNLNTFNLLYSDNVIAYTINSRSQDTVIKKYQERLTELGYYHGPINGEYTIDFRDAIKDYQYNNSQIVNGWIGPSTKYSLDSKFAKPFSIHYGQRNSTIKKVQEQLNKLKYLKENLITSTYGEYTAQAVAYFQKSNSLEITGVIDGNTFYKIFSYDALPSPIGFVTDSSQFLLSKDDIKKQTSIDEYTGTSEDLIKVAELKLGTKYVWGAKGPNKFDCSGFVYWCLNQIGFTIPYMTTYNWQYTTNFERIEDFDNLNTGDIIIIDGHIGIVCEDMTVIDASSSNGKVVHRDLDDWWRKRFIVGFRLFNDNKETN